MTGNIIFFSKYESGSLKPKSEKLAAMCALIIGIMGRLKAEELVGLT